MPIDVPDAPKNLPANSAEITTRSQLRSARHVFESH
jgi:hypothetical protein